MGVGLHERKGLPNQASKFKRESAMQKKVIGDFKEPSFKLFLTQMRTFRAGSTVQRREDQAQARSSSSPDEALEMALQKAIGRHTLVRYMLLLQRVHTRLP